MKANEKAFAAAALAFVREAVKLNDEIAPDNFNIRVQYVVAGSDRTNRRRQLFRLDQVVLVVLVVLVVHPFPDLPLVLEAQVKIFPAHQVVHRAQVVLGVQADQVGPYHRLQEFRLFDQAVPEVQVAP